MSQSTYLTVLQLPLNFSVANPPSDLCLGFVLAKANIYNSPLYSQGLTQHLAYRMHSINICYVIKLCKVSPS